MKLAAIFSMLILAGCLGHGPETGSPTSTESSTSGISVHTTTYTLPTDGRISSFLSFQEDMTIAFVFASGSDATRPTLHRLSLETGDWTRVLLSDTPADVTRQWTAQLASSSEMAVLLGLTPNPTGPFQSVLVIASETGMRIQAGPPQWAGAEPRGLASSASRIYAMVGNAAGVQLWKLEDDAWALDVAPPIANPSVPTLGGDGTTLYVCGLDATHNRVLWSRGPTDSNWRATQIQAADSGVVESQRCVVGGGAPPSLAWQTMTLKPTLGLVYETVTARFQDGAWNLSQPPGDGPAPQQLVSYANQELLKARELFGEARLLLLHYAAGQWQQCALPSSWSSSVEGLGLMSDGTSVTVALATSGQPGEVLVVRFREGCDLKSLAPVENA